MKYSRFEMLALGVGGAAIGSTLIVSLLGTAPAPVEIVSQLLLLGVFVAAVHWGRNGGFLAALAATVVYIALQARVIAAGGVSAPVVQLVVAHTVIYGLVGIVGGEACGRMKYLFARLDDDLNVDAATHVYTGGFLGRVVSNHLARNARYGHPFAVVLVTLDPSLTSQLKPPRRQSLLRTVANHIRNDVRLVDDVGRLDDGTFVLLLPQAGVDGATIAAERVRANTQELLAAKDGAVNVRVLVAPADTAEIEALRDRIDPAAAAQSA